MKILLTGGGTGGHFYPLIAIAEKLIEISDKEKIIDLKLYYMADKPYDKRMLFENTITFIQVPAGKMRLYFSLKNISDLFKTMSGLFLGFFSMFFIYPDVVISKGGYAAFPAVFASKLLRIPVIVHESDSYPGRLNVWTAKFAQKVAISWPEAIEYLPKEKTAHTGQPIRKNILHGDSAGAFEFFKLDSSLPVILVIGGSSGAEIINNIIIEVLPELLSKYQIIHQTGINNIDDVSARSKLVMENNENISRYVAVPYLNNLATRMAAGIATIVISRAGSAIFEIASWGIPSIIIPITNSNGNHQRKNAYNYARTKACEVIEEANLTPHVLISEIDKIINNKEKLALMKEGALNFANPDAAHKIALEAIQIAQSHEEI
ncbi:MAG: UDP diphospho-muramoyl pentapeptide beta-N acetylglucosaminyl transferase [Candidatus Nomurabacteria bacterium GW2011_GWF2_35_66]|uniref:UDP-N-acetylglucosamine--N-acetylmuramyl-(pentapeptide) pyrophosphoryl-undecaprenol N-acetylglucosamine transferase n=1 Tax=Candidatus Nomurabacteria bacterium GW2011_GWE1_35_16 TaxID=1618761 RepID=A0A0G0EH31_9BACT|nr:MAG: UDP diphospho-muramoyl pentapeptide beta-N acetylglucosaminyl transferase [Candidatus Nomurabacteria bacterium GW2011_GWF1_34_20]KKP63380.1 MAG: UDP diphospho-muramoyl pentapeptide beta-N acetylglucosaminyl transferase [Candidatus Nomurabacteria bacterium GW2011_GWE2_34_25]KKP66572.1 MAG: UDP diphospho-muramoyl pentapeptide beta-N acetylglucosaminyl transferase [Candidatus Nomurabacteria bacterium GW2011_GWE1_35_16]KKP83618.1 MAG: UDP diphospho-muramoyl pentapeptide beta-N acetylglucosam